MTQDHHCSVQEHEKNIMEPEAAQRVPVMAVGCTRTSSSRKTLERIGKGCTPGQKNSGLLPRTYRSWPSSFSTQRKRYAEQKIIDYFKIPSAPDQVPLILPRSESMLFDSTWSCLQPSQACPDAIQHLHKGLHELFISEAEELRRELYLVELITAVEGVTIGKVPGLDGLSIKFYKTFWPLLGPDLLHIFQNSLKDGILPVSC